MMKKVPQTGCIQVQSHTLMPPIASGFPGTLPPQADKFPTQKEVSHEP
jgi:hypothetical protein